MIVKVNTLYQDTLYMDHGLYERHLHHLLCSIHVTSLYPYLVNLSLQLQLQLQPEDQQHKRFPPTEFPVPIPPRWRTFRPCLMISGSSSAPIFRVETCLILLRRAGNVITNASSFSTTRFNSNTRIPIPSSLSYRAWPTSTIHSAEKWFAKCASMDYALTTHQRYR